MPYPREYTFDETNTPEYVSVIRQDESVAHYSVTVRLTSSTEVHVLTTNIGGISVDFEKAIFGAGLTAQEVIAAVNMMRVVAPTVKLVLEPSESGVYIHYRFKLPQGVTVRDVVDATGNKVPFLFDVINNAIVISYYFHSIAELTLVLNSVVNNITYVMTSILIYKILITAAKMITKMVREAV
jgi:hypothetical protein